MGKIKFLYYCNILILFSTIFIFFDKILYQNKNSNSSTIYLINHLDKKDTLKLDSIFVLLESIKKLKDTQKIAESYKNLGELCFEIYPKYSIIYFDSAQIYFRFLKKYPEQALCLQNMAFAFDEKLFNSDSSLIYAKKSLTIWTEISSRMNEANMLKYTGYLYGQKEQYDSAFINLRTSILLFKTLKNIRGIAVCHFDMALVFKKKGEIDSCLYYAMKAKDTWASLENSMRVFKINNMLLEVYIQGSNIDDVNELVKENMQFILMRSKNSLYFKDIDTFFNNSISFYTSINDENSLENIKKQRQVYLENLERNK